MAVGEIKFREGPPAMATGPHQFIPAVSELIVSETKPGVAVQNVKEQTGGEVIVYSSNEEALSDLPRIFTRGNSLVVMHSASWCDTCEKYKPVFARLAKEAGENFQFIIIEDDAFAEKLPSVPVVILYLRKGYKELPARPLSMEDLNEEVRLFDMPAGERLALAEKGIEDPDVTVQARSVAIYSALVCQLPDEEFIKKADVLLTILKGSGKTPSARFFITAAYRNFLAAKLPKDKRKEWEKEIARFDDNPSPSLWSRIKPSLWAVGVHAGRDAGEKGPRLKAGAVKDFRAGEFSLGPKLEVGVRLSGAIDPSAGAALMSGRLMLDAGLGYRFFGDNKYVSLHNGPFAQYGLSLNAFKIPGIDLSLILSIAVQQPFDRPSRASVMGGVDVLAW